MASRYITTLLIGAAVSPKISKYLVEIVPDMDRETSPLCSATSDLE